MGSLSHLSAQPQKSSNSIRPTDCPSKEISIITCQRGRLLCQIYLGVDENIAYLPGVLIVTHLCILAYPTVDGCEILHQRMVDTRWIMGCLPPFSTGDSDFATIHSISSYEIPSFVAFFVLTGLRIDLRQLVLERAGRLTESNHSSGEGAGKPQTGKHHGNDGMTW